MYGDWIQTQDPQTGQSDALPDEQLIGPITVTCNAATA